MSCAALQGRYAGYPNFPVRVQEERKRITAAKHAVTARTSSPIAFPVIELRCPSITLGFSDYRNQTC
ncbi:hypothetical protein NITHO_1830026 [Nitrolancea hollandica Lb]|uniref:Uncharacterized protein n=1 Tax=Nitrolancea hollandica Lb TaxID=1129897 RepID=I4EEI2_9BACT|nr:hypothetical protein NITHO_1830026 [Nitrolancea hollandica Lb]